MDFLLCKYLLLSMFHIRGRHVAVGQMHDITQNSFCLYDSQALVLYTRPYFTTTVRKISADVLFSFVEVL